MVKIVLNHKRIFLTSCYSPEKIYVKKNTAMISFAPDQQRLADIIDLFLVSEFDNLIIEDVIESSLNKLKSIYTTVTAGGGIVRNYKNDYLFIYRHKMWDLPKGKIEEYESVSAGALREVSEETGLRELSILEDFTRTYHMYFEGDLLLKETHWFLMQAEDVYLRPQQSEGITRAIWVHPNNLSFQFARTYDSVLDIFRKLGYDRKGQRRTGFNKK